MIVAICSVIERSAPPPGGAGPLDRGRGPLASASDGAHRERRLRLRLFDRIAQKQSQIVERDVELAVKMMLDQMAACLAGGGRIEIRGFGSFSLRFRNARVGRDPRTGTAVALPARSTPHFKPGKRLRERVNREYRGPSEAQRHAGGSEDPQVRSGR